MFHLSEIANPLALSAQMGAPGSVEDGLTMRSDLLDCIDSTFYRQEGHFLYDGGTFPHNTTRFQPNGGLSTTVATGNMSLNNAYLRGLTGANATALASVPAPLSTDCGTFTHGFDFISGFHDFDFSTSFIPSLTSANPIPPPPRDGIGFPPHPHEAPASNLVSPSDPLSDLGLTPLDDVLTSALVGISKDTSHSCWFNYTDDNFNTDTATTSKAAATTTTAGAGRAGMVLGKRARKCSSGSPKKRASTSTSWVLEEAEETTKRTRPSHTPATGTQKTDKVYIHESTTQSREARTITTQGLYPHPFLGPSAAQVTRGSPEQGQSERREWLETQHASRSTQVEPQNRSTEGREGLYAIPSTLTERQQLMLQTNEDDVKRRAVLAIKCRLCPSVALNSWQCFRRHCSTSEDHPAQLTFCERCGDHFGRRDSEKRHKGKKYQDACRTTPRDQAVWKKKTVKHLFEDFNAAMESCLRTGEELGPRFAAIVQAKVASTSKKHKRIRLEGDS